MDAAFESRGSQLVAVKATRPTAPFIQPSIRRPVPRGSPRDGYPPEARKNPPNAVGLPYQEGSGWWRAQEQADLVTNSEGPSSMMPLSASYTVA
ncbi:MAG: hypothetical protein R3C45_14480 [Phycisphaerales bacterium]